MFGFTTKWFYYEGNRKCWITTSTYPGGEGVLMRRLRRPWRILANPQKCRRGGGAKRAAVQKGKRLKKKKWSEEQSESILIWRIRVLFQNPNPIWVAKIFTFLLTDITAAETEAWLEGKSVLAGRARVRARFFRALLFVLYVLSMQTPVRVRPWCPF